MKKKYLEKHSGKIVFIVLIFMAVVSILNAKNESAIFDETAHIPASYSYVKLQDMRLNPEHPPLIKDLAGLPLLFTSINFDTSQKFWTENPDGQWEAGRSFLWNSGNDADKIIFLSRLPIVIISLLLGFFIFRWTKELAGAIAGLFALVLYAFDPNILGHNHFVTTDIGIATFMVFSFYYFLRFIKKPVWRNVFLGGFFLGLVQLAKFSSVLLFPIFGLTLIIYPLCKNQSDNEGKKWIFKIKDLSSYLIKGIVAFIFSLFVVWTVYFFNTWKMPTEKLDSIINYQFNSQSQLASARIMNKTLLSLNQTSLGKPLAEYLLGVGMVFKRVAGGNGAYFMGKVSSQAFPLYFPIVFILKEPLASLFLYFLSIAISCFCFFHYLSSKEKIPFTSLIRLNITSFSMVSFIFLYSYISLTGNLNIGFRHLFPILPFIYILSAKIIFDFIKKMTPNNRSVWNWIIIFLTIFLVSETIISYPYYMSYFNQIGGGPKKGYHYVTDSNADWGQDLKRLRVWVEDYNAHKDGDWCKLEKYNYTKDCQAIQKIHLNYFGGADIKYYFGDIAIDWWDSRRPIMPGFYAISTNYLQGSLYDKTKPDEESYRWTKKIKPIAQVGTSFFVYYITPEEATRIK